MTICYTVFSNKHARREPPLEAEELQRVRGDFKRKI